MAFVEANRWNVYLDLNLTMLWLFLPINSTNLVGVFSCREHPKSRKREKSLEVCEKFEALGNIPIDKGTSNCFAVPLLDMLCIL